MLIQRLLVSVLTLAFLTLGASAAFAAVDAKKMEEIKTLTQELYSIKMQLIDKQVEAGLLEKDKAEKIKTRMEQRQKRIEEEISNGTFKGFGKKRGCGHKTKNSQSMLQFAPSPTY